MLELLKVKCICFPFQVQAVMPSSYEEKEEL
jgi:hypothetical protein